MYLTNEFLRGIQDEWVDTSRDLSRIIAEEWPIPTGPWTKLEVRPLPRVDGFGHLVSQSTETPWEFNLMFDTWGIGKDNGRPCVPRLCIPPHDRMNLCSRVGLDKGLHRLAR